MIRLEEFIVAMEWGYLQHKKEITSNKPESTLRNCGLSLVLSWSQKESKTLEPVSFVIKNSFLRKTTRFIAARNVSNQTQGEIRLLTNILILFYSINMSTNSRYRKIIRLRENDRLTFEEIGVKLGITRQRAWALYRRAISRPKISRTSTIHRVFSTT